MWCEKPLALTMEELDQVEAAWKASDKVLFVGFNRSDFRPPSERSGTHFAGAEGLTRHHITAPTRPLPEKHWYHDRRQGGRLLGEACHFVDTCDAIVRAPVTQIEAMATDAESQSWPTS